MKIRLICVADGFRLETDADYEKKRLLKIGQVYEASIVKVRNPKFHRLYFQLIRCAWDAVGEQWQSFFNYSAEGFRKCVEVAAGSYDMMYSPARNEWVQVPRSIAFDKMSEEEFSTLYDRVKDVLYDFFLKNVDKHEFEEQLKYY